MQITGLLPCRPWQWRQFDCGLLPGITDVDPIELNLYFERFLNPERTSPPDFDIDFSYTDRDDVMDYLFKRYGMSGWHCSVRCQLSNGMAPSANWEKYMVYRMKKSKCCNAIQTPVMRSAKKLLQYGRMILGFPVYPSVHPCGVIITEEPIINYGAVFMPPKGLSHCTHGYVYRRRHWYQ